MELGGGDFPEARAMVELLAAARQAGRNFDHAWDEALIVVQRGRTQQSERWLLALRALRHHRDAWRRAYYREEPTSLDNAGSTLALVLESLYDDSSEAEPQFISLPEAA